MKTTRTETGQVWWDRLHKAGLCLPFAGYPLHLHEDISPFFIVGSGRSGNTLLRRLLNAHSQLFVPPETYVLGAVIRQFRRYNRMYWNDLVNLIYSNFQYHPEFETFAMRSLAPLAKRMSGCDRQQRSLALIIDGFYREYANTHGIEAQRWGDKTPANVYHLGKIFKVFPHAAVLHVIRHPCDVVYSYVHSGIYPDVEPAAKRWTEAVALCTDFGRRHRQSYLELRYENLVRDPVEEMRKVCRFLAIDFESAMLSSEATSATLGDVTAKAHHANVFKPITMDRIGRGKKEISRADIRRLMPIVQEQAERLGYKF